jgi:hypothetical protein
MRLARNQARFERAMRIGLFLSGMVALVALFAFSSACGNDASVRAKVAEPARSTETRCTIRGSQRLYSGTVIWSAIDRKVAIATSGGDVVHFAITTLPNQAGRARVTVRTAEKSPAFEIAGTVELRELSLWTTREIPIIERHAWLANDARVAVARDGGAAGADERARVHAEFGAFASLEATAPCDALTLDAPKSSAANQEIGRENKPISVMHFKRAGVNLKDERGAIILGTGGDGESATVDVLESRGALRRIGYDDGVRLDAWVDADALADGAGPDCDDCHGSIRDINDKCPDYPDDDDADGCPAVELVIGTAHADVPIHISPEENSLILGKVERGAQVLVVDKPEKTNPHFARVRPRHIQLTPVTGDFFVERRYLETSFEPAH